jgi:hypothetical protein
LHAVPVCMLRCNSLHARVITVVCMRTVVVGPRFHITPSTLCCVFLHFTCRPSPAAAASRAALLLQVHGSS